MTTSVDADEDLQLYRTMYLIRRFETLGGELFAAGKIPGFIHLSLGQEAVAAGVCTVLDPRDNISTTHRGHGHCLAKGADVTQMMAELYGNEGGVTRGRAGSMHASDSEVGILGANGIVGGGIPMAVGAALSAQLDGDGRVSVAFFGDGAVGEGVFTESVNLASLWRLPMIFVCENNGYAELTATSVHLANTSVAELVRPYGLAAETIDGNDVAAVRAASAKAVARARAGEGPSLIECDTTRWRGHFEGDPQRYRPAEEIRAMTTRDPIAAWRRFLEERGVEAAALDAIEQEVDALVAVANDDAVGQAPSRVDELLRDVHPEGASA